MHCEAAKVFPKQSLESSFYEFVNSVFQNDNYCKNILLLANNGIFESKRREYSFVLFNTKGIIFFATVPKGTDDDSAVRIIRTALNCLSDKLSLSLNSFVACGISENNIYHLNRYNDRLTSFELNDNDYEPLMSCVINDLSYSKIEFTVDTLNDLYDTLIFSSKVIKNKKEKLKVDADGISYVFKRGQWLRASDVDSDKMFFTTSLFGMFGAHFFYQHQIIKGFFYFFTMGMFGVGWFFDTLEMLLGVAKDKDGMYYGPVNNKKKAVLLFLGGLLIFVIDCLIFSFLFTFFSTKFLVV